MQTATPSHPSLRPASAMRADDDLPIVPPAPASAPYDAIAFRAYEIYIQSGRQPGRCEQYWRQAEQELRDEGHPAFDEQDTVYQEMPVSQHEDLAPQQPAESASDLLVWCQGGRHVDYRESDTGRRANGLERD